MARPRSLPAALKPYRVSSKFGPRDLPGSTDHLGCDWATPVGVPLEAIITGTVSAVGGSLTHGWGYYLHIRDKDGDEVEYHILRDRPKFKYGDRVTKGQIIGHTGRSGSLRGKRYNPHHHLGTKQNGRYYDPLTIGWPGAASGPLKPPASAPATTTPTTFTGDTVFIAIRNGNYYLALPRHGQYTLVPLGDDGNDNQLVPKQWFKDDKAWATFRVCVGNPGVFHKGD